MRKQISILEGLHESRINEAGKFKFDKYSGCRLVKNLGNIKKDTLFYCNDVMGDRVKLSLQSDNKYELILPISFAEVVFSDVSKFVEGKKYTLKIDIPYVPLEYIEDYNFSEKFISKYTKKYKGEDRIYFPKGTKFKYNGNDKVGTLYFLVDGEEVTFVDFSMIYGDDKTEVDFFDI